MIRIRDIRQMCPFIKVTVVGLLLVITGKEHFRREELTVDLDLNFMDLKLRVNVVY